LIKTVDIDSPVASIATKDGFSVCSFYVNEETGNIEMIVDKIPQVNADTVDFNGVTLARSESGMLLFEDKLGFQVELSDLIQQVSAGTAGPLAWFWNMRPSHALRMLWISGLSLTARRSGWLIREPR
jgi:hypothetical protein